MTRAIVLSVCIFFCGCSSLSSEEVRELNTSMKEVAKLKELKPALDKIGEELGKLREGGVLGNLLGSDE